MIVEQPSGSRRGQTANPEIVDLNGLGGIRKVHMLYKAACRHQLRVAVEKSVGDTQSRISRHSNDLKSACEYALN